MPDPLPAPRAPAPPNHRPEPLGDAYRRRRTLTVGESALLELVGNLARNSQNPRGWCTAGNGWLGDELGIHPKSVQRMCRHLQGDELLEQRLRRGKTPLRRPIASAHATVPMTLALSTSVNPVGAHALRGGERRGSPRGERRRSPTNSIHTSTPSGAVAGVGHFPADLFAEGWFNPMTVVKPGEWSHQAVARMQPGYAWYLGRDPRFACCRSPRSIASVSAGDVVLFLKLEGEGERGSASLRVPGTVLGGWRFR